MSDEKAYDGLELLDGEEDGGSLEDAERTRHIHRMRKRAGLPHCEVRDSRLHPKPTVIGG